MASAHTPAQAVESLNPGHAELSAQITAATGCTDRVASIAAGSYINCRNMPDYGLGDPPYGYYALHSAALFALRDWLASASSKKAA